MASNDDTPVWGGGRWGRFAWPATQPTDFYRVDGEQIPGLVSEQRTWQSTTLTWRVTRDVLEDRLAWLQETAEKHDVNPNSDGGYRAVDRSGTTGLVELEPPGTRRPPRRTRDVYVASYRERRLQQSDATHEVTVEFTDQTQREPDGTATVGYGAEYGDTYGSPSTRGAREWRFRFRSGDIVTRSVRYDPEQGTDTAADIVSLEVVLDAAQTKLLEESATRLAATTVREVPDGQNEFDDDTTGALNTIEVATADEDADGNQVPPGDPIRGGEWIVVDWSSRWLSDVAYRVSVTLGVPHDRGYSADYGYDYGG